MPSFMAGATHGARSSIIGVLDVLACNGLDALDGVGTLRDLLAEIRSAGSMQTLADLAEAIHQLNHVLCDALEQIPALDHP